MLKLLLAFALAAVLPMSSPAACPDDATPINPDDVTMSDDELLTETDYRALTSYSAMEVLRDILCEEEKRETALSVAPKERRAAEERAKVESYMTIMGLVFFAEEHMLLQLNRVDISLLLADYDAAIAPRPTVSLLRYKNASEYARVCHANLRRCLQEVKLQFGLKP